MTMNAKNCPAFVSPSTPMTCMPWRTDDGRDTFSMPRQSVFRRVAMTEHGRYSDGADYWIRAEKTAVSEQRLLWAGGTYAHPPNGSRTGGKSAAWRWSPLGRFRWSLSDNMPMRRLMGAKTREGDPHHDQASMKSSGPTGAKSLSRWATGRRRRHAGAARC